MSGSKHTSGPWLVSGRSSSDLIFISEFSQVEGDRRLRGKQVATVMGAPCGNAEEGVANARLIAAAPDLLAALHEAEGSLSDPHEGQWLKAEALRVVRAAIAKATGEEA